TQDSAGFNIIDLLPKIIPFFSLVDLVALSQVNRRCKDLITNKVLAEHCKKEHGLDNNSSQCVLFKSGWDENHFTKAAIINHVLEWLPLDDEDDDDVTVVREELNENGYTEVCAGYVEIKFQTFRSVQPALSKVDSMFQDLNDEDFDDEEPWICLEKKKSMRHVLYRLLKGGATSIRYGSTDFECDHAPDPCHNIHQFLQFKDPSGNKYCFARHFTNV
ncbi:MAG: hypothetical protein SGARI_001952, partial [Bacillariaceae sp.]